MGEKVEAGARTVHRALADERRAGIVAELRRAREGLDVQALAARLGLHANTIRFHLGVLVDAGLVSSRPAARSTAGRPRIVYSLEPSAAGVDRDEYRLLASVLTGAVAGSAGGPAAAEDAGRAWGRYLVNRPLPLVQVDDADAVDEVVDLLDAQGFAPASTGTEIRMRRCPFHDLAETHPEVVCAVHRGLISGALGELGSNLDVDSLDVFVEPDLCIARLRRAGRPPGSG